MTVDVYNLKKNDLKVEPIFQLYKYYNYYLIEQNFIAGKPCGEKWVVKSRKF